MPAPRALIVDDSRTAQIKLKKLLHRYHLEVDMATSAEEALGYLSYRMPSVIFMDHHLEGMDGFEALKIIKANPSTATIPVIMYTSQSNEVYASQAHALGALDTLSKSLMKPARIEEVLSKLDMSPNSQQSKTSPDAASTIRKSQNEQEIYASELKAQIARLFELHIADVRTQISENTKFIVRRLAAEIKNSDEKEHRFDDIPFSVLNEEARVETTKIGIVSNALLALILVALAAISFQIFQNYRQTERLEDKYEQLADINYQESLLLDDLVVANRRQIPDRPNPSAASTSSDNTALFRTIGWAMGLDMSFDFGEEALSEKRVINLQNLTYRLDQAGFKGLVELNIHLGNFCLKANENGGFNLAPDPMPISECLFLQDQKLDLSSENYTSVAYLQFEQSSAPLQKGDIDFLINVNDLDNNLMAYPSKRAPITAVEWNRFARRNQKVVVELEPSQ